MPFHVSITEDRCHRAQLSHPPAYFSAGSFK